MKKIYLYTTDAVKKTSIEKLCSSQQIELHTLEYQDINKTVSVICGMPLKAAKEHRQPPVMYVLPEVMLFYGIDDKALDDFLDAYNAAGINKIQRKAIVTPSNLGWTLYELAEELGKEI
ncbi:MAG: DUF3783 domain-containing protein [Lachnospiraceae bacterium]|nr:DUF3783 domain-containing protein [Lachnospiraceae bacterium]